MKKLLLIFLLSASLLSSCTSPLGVERNIANAKPPLTYEELLTFENMDTEAGLNINASTIQSNDIYKIEFKKDKELPENISLKMDLEVGLGEYKMIVTHAGREVSQSSVSEFNTFLSYTSRHSLNSRYSLAELLYNAKEGDITSLSVLAKLRRDNVKNTISNAYFGASASPELSERLAFWEEKVKEFEKAEKAEAKTRKAKIEQRKAIIDKLDKATEDKQLKTLVAKNDRKGVAELLRTYLPWEQMPPFEKKYWETQLDIMVNPLPMDKRIMIYRGIQDDLINSSIVDGVELSKDKALKEHKIFLMSTILTKNQGSYNRRLRSLTAMYEKTIASPMGDSTYTRAARISTMFSVHASDPVGSPFMSFSPRYAIAHNFGHNRKTVFFLDPRALTYNTSGIAGEVEFLLPLITFPDELGAVYDATEHAGFSNSEDTLHKFAIQNLDEKYGKGKGEALFKKIQENSKKYFGPVISPYEIKFSSDFFKHVLGKDVAQVTKKMTPDANIQCTDIIQLFW